MLLTLLASTDFIVGVVIQPVFVVVIILFLAAQQVTQEAREQIEKDKKAIKQHQLS